MRSITLTGAGDRTGSYSSNAMGLAEFYGLSLADPANRRTWWPEGVVQRERQTAGSFIYKNPLARINV